MKGGIISGILCRRLIIAGIVIIIIMILLPVTVTAESLHKTGNRHIVVFDNSFAANEDKENILRNTGMKKVKDLPLINAVVVESDDIGIKSELEGQEGILRVEKDAEIRVLGSFKQHHGGKPSDEILPWGVGRISANAVWDKNNDLSIDRHAIAGGGVRVALLDTGVDLSHPDLVKNIKKGFNAVDPNKPPYDVFGHGTHVAGTIAAVDNRIGVIGTAPKAWLYPVKVMDDEGYGTISDVIEALDWCIKNRIQIINMSFGTPEDIQSLHEAIIAAYNSGIVMVAAAGNEGPGDGTVQYPAKYTEVIAVSAVDNADTLTPWSSWGTEVEFTAPGADIMSTFLDGGYIAGYGTSMAAPHVTGTAALIISSGIRDINKNGIINDEVRAIMRNTAEDLGEPGADSQYGYGIINAAKAVNTFCQPHDRRVGDE